MRYGVNANVLFNYDVLSANNIDFNTMKCLATVDGYMPTKFSLYNELSVPDPLKTRIYEVDCALKLCKL